MYLSHLAPGLGGLEITRNEDKVEGKKGGRTEGRKEEKREGEMIFTQSKNKDKDINRDSAPASSPQNRGNLP